MQMYGVFRAVGRFDEKRETEIERERDGESRRQTLIAPHGNGTAIRTGTGVPQAQSPRWELAHERLVRFAKRRAGLEWREGRLLREAFAAQVHRRLGYGSFAEYVERLFGYGARTTAEKLRVAESLEQLPLLTRALQQGELTWSAVRELTRVVVSATEEVWFESAKGKSCREIEGLVGGLALGDLPSDTKDPRLVRHVLRFEVSAETLALFREAVAKLRRETGESLDDDAALLLLARGTLGGPKDSGRSNYQVEVRVCERCQQAEQLGNGARALLTPAVAEMCECDAQHIEGERAAQKIPPATRRQVHVRDGGRCVVSGCRHATFIDVHHLRWREDGGDHSPDNLACLCGAHHRAVHEGKLVVAGTPTRGLAFYHADGKPYGARSASASASASALASASASASAKTSERNALVFGALRGLGFGERECRTALERSQSLLGNSATREALLRATLALLSERRAPTA